MRRLVVLWVLLNGLALAGPIGTLNRFLDWMDSVEVSMLDTNYVTLYPEWWRLSVSGLWSNSNMNLRELDPYYGAIGNLDADSKMRIAGSLAFRNWGVSYTWDVDHLDKSFNLSYIGNIFGAELLINRVSSLSGTLKAYSWAETEEEKTDLYQYIFDVTADDLKFNNVLVDFYYVFNNDEFSYGAAISQSHRQKKSAGSWLMSGGYIFSKFEPSEQTTFMDISGVNNIQIGEVALGFGYGHNFVYNMLHNSQFLVHFSLIPTLVLWNYYEGNFEEGSRFADDYGTTLRESDWVWDDFKNDSQKIVWFFRSSFVYTYKQFFTGVYNMFVRQSLSKGDDLDLSLDIWTIRAFVGIRL